MEKKNYVFRITGMGESSCRRSAMRWRNERNFFPMFGIRGCGVQAIVRVIKQGEVCDLGVFKIDVENMEWIGGAADDPQDLCLHGRVTVRFGDTILVDYGTVSATALYLLKTLSEDKIMAPYDIQMIPCCGHTLIANDDLTEAAISGCDTGADWTTIHEGDTVRFILPSGQEEVVTLREYQYEVLGFAGRQSDFMMPARRRKCLVMSLTGMDISRSGMSGSGVITKD